MKRLNFFVTLVLLVTFVSTTNAQFDPNYKGFYYLQTQFRGDAEMLESNGAASKTMNGAAFMSTQKGATGQQWKFVPEPGKPGFYRLKTLAGKDELCLEGNQMRGTYKNGVSVMMKCQNVSGQLWKVEDAKNGFYRLITLFKGNEFCLEGNKAGGGAKDGNAFMDTRQNVSGQMWKFVKVTK